MTSLLAKELLVAKYLPVIEPVGYSLKRAITSEFRFTRKTKSGNDNIVGGFTDYNPTQRIIYSFSKVSTIVNEILLKVQEMVGSLNPKVSKDSSYFGFSYSSLNGLSKLEYLPDVQTEAEMDECVNLMRSFTLETAFPIMEKMNDFRELDSIINGSEPWTTDWHMPYGLSGEFYVKRLIIAKLAGNPNYEELIDFNYTTLERLSAEAGSPFVYDRNNLKKSIPAVIELLKGVKPLY